MHHDYAHNIVICLCVGIALGAGKRGGKFLRKWENQRGDCRCVFDFCRHCGATHTFGNKIKTNRTSKSRETMKNTHILILLCFAVAMGAVFVSLMDNSTYADFSDAFSHTGRKYTVAGSLDKEQNIDYDPKTNANLLSFHMLDKQGVKRKVILNQAKPQDFERAESLVVTGKAGEDGTFYATEVLMKCPSKYNENKKIGG